MLKDEKVREAVENILHVRFPYVKMQDTNRTVMVHWFDVIRAIEMALSTPPAQAEASTLPGEVVAWASGDQLAQHTDPEPTDPLHAEAGLYLPLRKTRGGKFTTPLYASPPTTPAVESGEDDRGFETEVTFEVWEDDMLVASSTDEADARHYLAVYSQDGPVKMVKAVTTRAAINGETT